MPRLSCNYIELQCSDYYNRSKSDRFPSITYMNTIYRYANSFYVIPPPSG